MSYPDKETLAKIRQSLKDNGVTDPRAEAQMIREFNESMYVPSEIDSRVVLLKDELAKPATGGDPFGEHADNIVTAFTGKGNADARSRLVKTIGQAAADEAARKFGLSGVGDFSRAGVVPDDVKPKDKATTNPWSAKFTGKNAEVARIHVIKTFGTKAASEMARSAGVDLAGRPLRGAAA